MDFYDLIRGVIDTQWKEKEKEEGKPLIGDAGSQSISQSTFRLCDLIGMTFVLLFL